MIVAISIAFAVLIVGFLIVSYVRRRNASFEGVVTDKDIRETQVTNQNNQPGTITLGNNGQTGIKHDYIIKVQTTQGKNITWSVSQGKYEIVKIGDHVTKVKGTTDIEITPQVAAPAPLQTPQSPQAPQPPTATPPIV